MPFGDMLYVVSLGSLEYIHDFLIVRIVSGSSNLTLNTIMMRLFDFITKGDHALLYAS